VVRLERVCVRYIQLEEHMGAVFLVVVQLWLGIGTRSYPDVGFRWHEGLWGKWEAGSVGCLEEAR